MPACILPLQDAIVSSPEFLYQAENSSGTVQQNAFECEVVLKVLLIVSC